MKWALKGINNQIVELLRNVQPIMKLKKGTFIAELSVSTRLSLINCLSPVLGKVLGGLDNTSYFFDTNYN